MSNPVFWEKNKKNINLSSVELAKRVVKVKGEYLMMVLHIYSSR